METYVYYGAVVYCLITAVFGVWLVGLAIVQQIGADNTPQFKLLSISRLLSGLVNILLGITLYRQLDLDLISNVLVMTSLTLFSLWEWFARGYFIEPIKEGRRDT